LVFELFRTFETAAAVSCHPRFEGWHFGGHMAESTRKVVSVRYRRGRWRRGHIFTLHREKWVNIAASILECTIDLWVAIGHGSACQAPSCCTSESTYFFRASLHTSIPSHSRSRQSLRYPFLTTFPSTNISTLSAIIPVIINIIGLVDWLSHLHILGEAIRFQTSLNCSYLHYWISFHRSGSVEAKTKLTAVFFTFQKTSSMCWMYTVFTKTVVTRFSPFGV
jgi:hypothetical protein